MLIRICKLVVIFALAAGTLLAQKGQTAKAVPPYHKTLAEAEPLPQTLSPSQFSNALVAEAYQIAEEIPGVLAQQPCYCPCSKEFGHTSLLDCFTSTHTAGCGICMAEAFYSYNMTKDGKTPAEIREGIIGGEWRTALDHK